MRTHPRGSARADRLPPTPATHRNADPGQTFDTFTTFKRMSDAKPDILFIGGDFSCALHPRRGPCWARQPNGGVLAGTSVCRRGSGRSGRDDAALLASNAGPHQSERTCGNAPAPQRAPGGHVVTLPRPEGLCKPQNLHQSPILQMRTTGQPLRFRQTSSLLGPSLTRSARSGQPGTSQRQPTSSWRCGGASLLASMLPGATDAKGATPPLHSPAPHRPNPRTTAKAGHMGASRLWTA